MENILTMEVDTAFIDHYFVKITMNIGTDNASIPVFLCPQKFLEIGILLWWSHDWGSAPPVEAQGSTPDQRLGPGYPMLKDPLGCHGPG